MEELIYLFLAHITSIDMGLGTSLELTMLYISLRNYYHDTRIERNSEGLSKFILAENLPTDLNNLLAPNTY